MIERLILVIDDEKRMTQSLRELLGGAGYEVQTAHSGEEGIEKLEAREFPVVITDLRMQDGDGLKVIRHIHESEPQTLVIVITGYASADSAIEALHYQAFDYLRKPFEFDALKAAVERAFHKLEVDQLRADTAAMLTHDIKVPLTSILGFTALMRDRETGELSPEAGMYLDRVRANALKILSLVDNYLARSKIDSGTLEVARSRVRIATMFGELRDALETEAAKREMALEFDGRSGPAEASFDEPYVFRALGNLLQNAIKYGDPAGPVRLRVRQLEAEASPLEGPALEFEVTNVSRDLKPENLAALFGRYERAAAGRGVEGTGLGLYVVDAVARAHGGLARAQCLGDGRVSFSLVLPLDLSE